MSLLPAKIKTEGEWPSDFSNVGCTYEEITDANEEKTSIMSEPSNYLSGVSAYNSIEQNAKNISALESKEQPASLRKRGPTSDSSRNVDLDSAWKHDSTKSKRLSSKTKRTSNGLNLTRHQASHSEAIPFQCLMCLKMCRSKKALREHAITHSNVKPYSCDICEKSFKSKKKLLGHQIVHSDDRPFKCSMCEYSFKTKRVLNTHYVCHSENRPFICDRCAASFKRKYELVSHQKKVHKFSKNTPLLSVEVETSEECTPEVATETIVGMEFDDIRDATEGQTSLFQEPSNFSPLVTIKQEPEDFLAFKNTEQPRSTWQKPFTDTNETNDNKYHNATDATEGQTLIKPESSYCSPVVGIEQEPEDVLAFKNTEQPRSTSQTSFTNANETNDNKYHNATDATEGQTLIIPESSYCSPVVGIEQEPEDVLAFKNTEQPRSTSQTSFTDANETNDNKYHNSTDATEGQTLIKPETSNFSPLVGIEQEPEDILAFNNTEQPRSTSQTSIMDTNETNDNKYHNAIEATEGQTLIKQESSYCSPVVGIKKEPEDILTFKGTKQSKRSTKPKPFTETNETNDIRYEDITSAIEEPYSINQEASNHTSVTLEHNLINPEPEDNYSSENIEKLSSYKKRRMVRIHMCEQCGKLFHFQSNLFDHLAVHSDERPFKCEHCDKTFKRKTYLICHERVHSVSKRFQCHLCDKSFKSEQTLNIHAQHHANEKRYPCKVCEKSFEFESVLRLHMTVHSDDRPFKCTICDNYFKNKNTLLKHIQSHSENRPFKCDKCGKSFKRKYDLNAHINGVHKFIPKRK